MKTKLILLFATCSLFAAEPAPGAQPAPKQPTATQLKEQARAATIAKIQKILELNKIIVTSYLPEEDRELLNALQAGLAISSNYGTSYSLYFKDAEVLARSCKYIPEALMNEILQAVATDNTGRAYKDAEDKSWSGYLLYASKLGQNDVRVAIDALPSDDCAPCNAFRWYLAGQNTLIKAQKEKAENAEERKQAEARQTLNQLLGKQ